MKQTKNSKQPNEVLSGQRSPRENEEDQVKVPEAIGNPQKLYYSFVRPISAANRETIHD
jgi:hypothetical protein